MNQQISNQSLPSAIRAGLVPTLYVIDPRSNWHAPQRLKWHLSIDCSELGCAVEERKTMARIEGVNPEEVEPYVRQVLEAQTRKWGAPLLNHLVYARRPSIFRGARGMWTGIGASGLIDERLQALINRRVASINGCVF